MSGRASQPDSPDQRQPGTSDLPAVVRLHCQAMKPIGQTIGRDMVKLTIALLVFVALWIDTSIAQPDSLDDVYTTRAVVTGKDETNRPLGFRLCFEDVLIKVSGDASIVSGLRILPPAHDNMSPRFPIVIGLRENQFTTNRAHMTDPIF
jgi:hypothetical protein